MSTNAADGGLEPQYQLYPRQKCILGYSQQASWAADLLAACEEVLGRPEFDLELDMARRHLSLGGTLREKALELIANARYGIYDLSYWRNATGAWQMPHNVLIELGMAIALNRPVLLLRHGSNRDIELPECLRGVDILGFSGETTLKRALEQRLPQWIHIPPEQDWRNRYCLFGGRSCNFREAEPRTRQRGQPSIACHISDGPDVDREDFRGVIEDVLGRFADVSYSYLDTLPIAESYTLLLCSYCQTIRSTSFAIYRITPYTPAETYIAIGISLALEKQFGYTISKILLTDDARDVPSLLAGYDVIEARTDTDRREALRAFLPSVIAKVREPVWVPRVIPFIEILRATEEAKPPEPSASARALVVDNTRPYREHLVRILQQLGCEVQEAETNSQALEALANARVPFALLTTDQRQRLQQAGLSGLDLIKQLNQRYPDLPVVLISQNRPALLKDLAPDLRVSGMLSKDLSDEDMLAAFRRVLAGESLPNPWTGRDDELAQRADAVLASLAPVERSIARRIFLRVQMYGESEVRRRPQPLSALRAPSDDPAAFDLVLRRLVDTRLLAISSTAETADLMVRIADESLVEGWPQLRQWRDERLSSEQLRRRLEAKAGEWQRQGRSAAALLDAAELAEAERWIAGPDADELGYSPTLAALIQASQATAERLETEEDEFRRQVLFEKRRRLRVLEEQAAAYGSEVPAHITAEIEELRHEVGPPETQLHSSNPSAASPNRPDNDLDRGQLEALLQELTEEAKHLNELQRVLKRRLQLLEEQRARRGYETPPEVILDLEDTQHELERRDREFQQVEERRAAVQRELETLDARSRQGVPNSTPA